jgi:hypothetical protein
MPECEPVVHALQITNNCWPILLFWGRPHHVAADKQIMEIEGHIRQPSPVAVWVYRHWFGRTQQLRQTDVTKPPDAVAEILKKVTSSVEMILRACVLAEHSGVSRIRSTAGRTIRRKSSAVRSTERTLATLRQPCCRSTAFTDRLLHLLKLRSTSAGVRVGLALHGLALCLVSHPKASLDN